jgi:hypothetical protein
MAKHKSDPGSSSVFPRAITLPAGTLQHALRAGPASFTQTISRPMGDQTHVQWLLEVLQPQVWRPDPAAKVYRVGGIRDLTRHLVSRLQPEVEVPCLEFARCPTQVPIHVLLMLARRLIIESEFEEWLADPKNWRNWFITDQPSGVTFGKFFGVKSKQGHKRLCDAQGRVVAKQTRAGRASEMASSDIGGDSEADKSVGVSDAAIASDEGAAP